jgi:hypothetical protein
MNGRNRILSILLAVCYGLAVTVSGLLHNHGDSCDGCRQNPSAAAQTEAQQSAHHDHLDQPGVPLQQSVPQECPPDGPRCFVCQFLAQKTLPFGPVTAAATVALVQEAGLPALPHSVLVVYPSWQSRAPPDVS